LANYVHVANTDGAAAILFDPAGLGGGTPVAVLAGDGGLAPGWQTAALFKV
jgi:hypothetical protein